MEAFAKYSYEASTASELSFNAGEKFIVINIQYLIIILKKKFQHLITKGDTI